MLDHRDANFFTGSKAASAALSDAPLNAIAALRSASYLSPPHRSAIESPAAVRPLGGASKRLFDIFVSTFALLVLSPALLVIALLVRLDSSGPILFRQHRGGYLNAPFLIYKFRTMTTCEDGSCITQAVRHDTRVTRLGAFLRKTSLDELPQLLNVLKGEMSLIGPRPHAIAHDNAFAAIEPRYQRRTQARPGITGLAQISGARGQTDTDEAVRKRLGFDLDYISQWSPLLDAAILVRTVFLVFRDRNAF